MIAQISFKIPMLRIALPMVGFDSNSASLRTLRFASSALRMTRGRREVGERISDPCPKENCDFCEKNDNLV